MAFLLCDVARISGLDHVRCLRKIRHETFREALAHKESVIYCYGEDPDGPLYVYRCQDCGGGWHVGRRRVIEEQRNAG